MDPEFIDPGPNQPPPGYGPTAGPPWAEPPAPVPAAVAPPPGRRESLGLLVMLLAAAGLPFVAAAATLYSVALGGADAEVSWAVDAWGDPAGGPYPATHAPRFGVLLIVAGAGFTLLVLITAVQLLGARAAQPARVAGLVAGASTGLVGLLAGVAASMTLEIQSTFEGFRAAAGGYEVRVRVGDAVWLALAGILAGGLSVTAALRVRRTFRAAASGY